MKSYRPTSPSRRQMTTLPYRTLLSGTEPTKSLTYGRKRAVGRNNVGRITVRHKGGGHKRRFREIDFTYDKVNIPAKIESIEYDPNRSGFIGLVLYKDGARRYVLLPGLLKVGDTFIVSEEAPLTTGNRLPLRKIPVGTFVYNIELEPGKGGKMARSAGSSAQVLAHEAGYVNLKMPSTEIRKVKDTCFASIGMVSNQENRFYTIGKAGKSRLKGRRPHVRGSAMNPVDHPHGGGEGRQPIGLKHPKTPWGKPALGVKTRRKKKWTSKYIIQRRKK